MIFEMRSVGLMGVNCYLAGDENELLIVDPGSHADEIYALASALSARVAYIVLTHCHFDHIMAAEFLREKTGASLVVCEKEAENLQNSSVNMTARFSRTPVALIPDKTVGEGDVLTVGAYSFCVIETPGHTSGGMCLYCESERLLFSGDTLFYAGVGRSDFPTGDHAVLHSSIQEKLFSLPEDTVVYPGHERSTTIGFEKHNNPYIQ